MNEDPYSSMRQAGEADDLAEKFRKGGLDKGKIAERIAKSVKRAKDAASKINNIELSDDQIKIITRINEKEYCLYEEFSDIDDVNAKLSKLMPDYVNKVNNRFYLMALGRKIVGDLAYFKNI
jgi:hypothetical protein